MVHKYFYNIFNYKKYKWSRGGGAQGSMIFLNFFDLVVFCTRSKKTKNQKKLKIMDPWWSRWTSVDGVVGRRMMCA